MKPLNTFSEIVSGLKRGDNTTNEKNAMKYIISDLMLAGKKGELKYKDCELGDRYEIESKSAFPIMPGHVYIFVYNPDNPVNIDVDGCIIDIEDKMPLVLCTGVNEKTITGINLNICPSAMRTTILNETQNIDPEYYSNGIKKMARMGNVTPSPNIIKLFSDTDGRKRYNNYICEKTGIINRNLIFRQYNISKIKNIRLVEVWAWKYMPFLSHYGSFNKSQITMIHKKLKKKN